jgi:hypothetical protein
MKKIDRELIFNKFDGKCAYCGDPLKKGWHVDELLPVRRNKDGTCMHPERFNIDNQMPSCPGCNIQKNSYTLEQFRENIKQFVNSLNQYSTQYKFAKKYGLVSETDIQVKFHFETVCSNDWGKSEHLPNMTLEQAIAKAKPNLDKIKDVDKHLDDIR